MRVTTEWFPIVLGTMVLSLTSWIDYTVFNVSVAYDIGKGIYFVALALLFVLLLLWLSGYSDPKNLKEDLSSVQRISFTAFLAVLMFVSGFFYTVYISSSPTSITWLSYLFFLGFSLALVVNVITWVKIYLSEGVTLGYGLLVPSIALSADVVLGAPILPPFSYVLKDVTLIYAVMLFSLGITTLQFVFLGSASLMSHIQGNRAFPTVMIPLGAASIIGINVLSFPAYNYLGFVDVPTKVAIGIGISLFGFEVWNLVLGFIIALRRVRDPPSLMSWAYVFPVGISMFSAFMLYQETGFPFFSWFIAALNLGVVGLYSFSVMNTVRLVRRGLKSSQRR
ncbi:hypothetical protein IC006_0562 [Sulfuracidifex tepidarius]|uniref:C4-dicarboxylate transporter/malic acid transport protein n=1 Tax=Sulfuracidifex tepidarius TaxID=1294262 RepID=A0A510DSZ5_9CREN|nr:hypothetical protein [Sulfuracidifex tepidarius]BBG23278.1 hypothetical protein IC006_0562 [Sulfuracidifex tepidarius]